MQRGECRERLGEPNDSVLHGNAKIGWGLAHAGERYFGSAQKKKLEAFEPDAERFSREQAGSSRQVTGEPCVHTGSFGPVTCLTDRTRRRKYDKESLSGLAIMIAVAQTHAQTGINDEQGVRDSSGGGMPPTPA
jgi:hypothetical protein